MLVAYESYLRATSGDCQMKFSRALSASARRA